MYLVIAVFLGLLGCRKRKAQDNGSGATREQND
jgi:hypothetical protein